MVGARLRLGIAVATLTVETSRERPRTPPSQRGRHQMTRRCRVCVKGQVVPFQSVDGRDYWRCTVCAATFVDASQLPDEEAERTRYTLHQNDPNDVGYRRFLWTLAVHCLSDFPRRKRAWTMAEGRALR